MECRRYNNFFFLNDSKRVFDRAKLYTSRRTRCIVIKYYKISYITIKSLIKQLNHVGFTRFVDQRKHSQDLVAPQNLFQISVTHVIPNELDVSDHEIFHVNIVNACNTYKNTRVKRPCLTGSSFTSGRQTDYNDRVYPR